MNTLKIKVCGMRDAENISAVAALEPDFIGHIFYERSPRFAGDADFQVLKTASGNVKRIGVFVDENLENILKQIRRWNLYGVQLHGNEPPGLCAELKQRTTVIKAFGVDEHFDFSVPDKYAGAVSFFLFDTKTAAYGGSGQVFDWKILDRYTGDTPFFLSGGIGPENLAEALAVKHPAFFGLDLNSRYEISPGLKDVEKLREAIEEIRGEQ